MKAPPNVSSKPRFLRPFLLDPLVPTSPGDANAVLYMMEKQDSFREVDFEILGNTKLLSQVVSWRGSGISTDTERQR